MSIKPALTTPASSSIPKTAFPIKLERLPSSFSARTSKSFDSLLNFHQNSEKDFDEKDLRKESSARIIQSANVSSGTSDEDDEKAISPFSSPSKVTSPKESPNASQMKNIASQKSVKISFIQYRHLIIPPRKSVHVFTDFKLIFLQSERLLVLSAKINNDLKTLSIPFSKVSRIQFIRQPSFSSADWYIDFVLTSVEFLDFKPFKGINDSDIIDNCMTLRINLSSHCGFSETSLENILMSIVKDRRAFYFSAIRDRYGEFEKSKLSSSPPKPIKPVKTYSSLSSSPAARHVPSLEALACSESVKINSSPRKPLSSVSSCSNSPDIFDSSKRASKRLKTSPTKSYLSSDLGGSYTYVDPEFDTDCTK